MPLLSEKEVFRLKLNTIPTSILRDLAKSRNIFKQKVSDIVEELIGNSISPIEIDDLIRLNYRNQIKVRQSVISDSQVLNELNLVEEFNWGVVQGQLDSKIQANYVRKYPKYYDLLRNIKSTLHNEITNYVICTWYNHWSTILIEDFISQHPKVVPTLKNVKGVDIFFDGQPFDLKITYLPIGFHQTISDAIREPKNLIIWLYENQGEQRFGSENRLFVILYDENKPIESWKIKRDIYFVQSKINQFFESEKITKNDEIVFQFNRNTYNAISKILFITK